MSTTQNNEESAEGSDYAGPEATSEVEETSAPESSSEDTTGGDTTAADTSTSDTSGTDTGATTTDSSAEGADYGAAPPQLPH